MKDDDGIKPIEWVDAPPPKKSGRPPGVVASFVEVLKSRPGQWAKYPPPMSQSAITPLRKHYPGTEWTARKRPDGKYDFYARWIGKVES